MLNAKLTHESVTTPPTDKNNTTLYISGTAGIISEEDIRNCFSGFGKLRSIKMVPKFGYAFITFVNRNSAEDAMLNLKGILKIKTLSLRVTWSVKKDDNNLVGKDTYTAVPPTSYPSMNPFESEGR